MRGSAGLLLLVLNRILFVAHFLLQHLLIFLAPNDTDRRTVMKLVTLLPEEKVIGLHAIGTVIGAVVFVLNVSRTSSYRNRYFFTP